MTTFCLFFTLILNKFLLRTKNYLLKNSCLYSFAKVKALVIIGVTLLNYLCVNSKKNGHYNSDRFELVPIGNYTQRT